MEKIYRHYGSKIFDKERFEEIKNKEMFCKPQGGLWASDEKSEYGWKEWTQDNNFSLEKYNNSNYFRFKLKEEAKVLTIDKSEDLVGLPRVQNYKAVYLPYVLLDFERLAKEYDAIEVIISTEEESEFMEGLYWDLYGWDCDSLLVFNKDVIEQIKEDLPK